MKINSLSPKRIPLNRPDIGFRERLAVDSVLRSGDLAQGRRVAGFENKFSSFVGNQNCVAVNSGTSALHLGLLALGIGPGDEVIVPSFTFAATANAVAITGARPVFVDIEENHFSINPEAVEEAISDRTKALIAVHLYGHPANMIALKRITEKHSIFLVEDAAQAHLAKLNGNPVGTWGDFSAFSFYPTKNMTTGEGGMAATHDLAIERKLRLLRNQGMETRYKNEVAGFNNRMTEVAAAIGLVQLERIKGWTDARQRNAKFLDNNLLNVITPKVADGVDHVYHQYTIRLVDQNRDRFVEELRKLGVDCDVYYPSPVHKLPAYALTKDLPVSEKVSKSCLSIPVHQNLSRSDLKRIVSAVNRLAGAGS